MAALFQCHAVIRTIGQNNEDKRQRVITGPVSETPQKTDRYETANSTHTIYTLLKKLSKERRHAYTNITIMHSNRIPEPIVKLSIITIENG
jgi:hypothetical protein